MEYTYQCQCKCKKCYSILWRKAVRSLKKNNLKETNMKWHFKQKVCTLYSVFIIFIIEVEMYQNCSPFRRKSLKPKQTLSFTKSKLLSQHWKMLDFNWMLRLSVICPAMGRKPRNNTFFLRSQKWMTSFFSWFFASWLEAHTCHLQ